ncbi:MAG TPA: zinc ribbon domain-containing protein [Pyrinomonadaceae bacterium]|nr:zinc ribbon domain-containing protein [Pyrinomonadaceae bacterium]
MYCSTCGVAVSQGLSFCKHCGAKLGVERGDDLVRYSEMRAESFNIAAMVMVFIFGLVAITGLLAVLKNGLDFETPQVIPFAIISFVMLFLLEGILIWRLVRRDRHAKAAAPAPPSEQTTKGLDAARARALSEGVPPSVTEHTTRAFEPVYGERKSG